LSGTTGASNLAFSSPATVIVLAVAFSNSFFGGGFSS